MGTVSLFRDSVVQTDSKQISHPEKEKDADAGKADGRVPGPDRLDVLEDADPRVDEAATRNLQENEIFHH